MGYLSVGSGYISSDLFLEIKNTNKIKSTGGLWATNYDLNIKNYNEWVDYLCSHPQILHYKNIKDIRFLPATHIVLKKDANIFTLDSLKKIKTLKEKYPLNDWIDFEKMACNYDGIYVDLRKMHFENNEESRVIANSFSVNTLQLFNLFCIEYYQKANVDLSNVNFNKYHNPGNYTITIDKKLQKIEETSVAVQFTIEVIKLYIEENNIQLNNENINKLKVIFRDIIAEVLKYQDVPDKETLLIRKVFNQF